MDRATHQIEWTFDQDYVRGRLICHAPDAAPCRWQATCECESWYSMGRDAEGPYHLAIEADPDDWRTQIEVRHAMTDGGECHIELFLNEGEITECCAPGLTFIAGRTFVEATWNGDYYEWRPTIAPVPSVREW